MRVVCKRTKHSNCSLAVEQLAYRSFQEGKEYDIDQPTGEMLLRMRNERGEPFFDELKPQADKMLKSVGKVKPYGA